MQCFDNYTGEEDPKFVSVEKCIFTNIHSPNEGGCILEERAVTLLISRTIFSSCSSYKNGGAFYVNNSDTYLTVHKSCFTKLVSNGVGIIYLAECKIVNSMLNLYFQNGNAGASFILQIQYSPFNDRQENYSNNFAFNCPCFYALYGTNANVKEITESNSTAVQGALIDTNHMTGPVVFERLNCVNNKIQDDKNGLFFFYYDITVELYNVYAFHNEGCNTFSKIGGKTIITAKNCYTDFQNPDISFIVSTYTFNNFKTLEYCFAKYSNKDLIRYLSIVFMFFMSTMTST